MNCSPFSPHPMTTSLNSRTTPPHRRPTKWCARHSAAPDVSVRGGKGENADFTSRSAFPSHGRGRRFNPYSPHQQIKHLAAPAKTPHRKCRRFGFQECAEAQLGPNQAERGGAPCRWPARSTRAPLTSLCSGLCGRLRGRLAAAPSAGHGDELVALDAVLCGCACGIGFHTKDLGLHGVAPFDCVPILRLLLRLSLRGTRRPRR